MSLLVIFAKANAGDALTNYKYYALNGGEEYTLTINIKETLAEGNLRFGIPKKDEIYCKFYGKVLEKTIDTH